VAPALALEVLTQNRNGYPRGSTISTYLDVHNVGNQPVNYADLTVRYWFSPEGAASLSYAYDWAQVGASNVRGQLGQQGTNTYFETSFDPSLGQLAPLSSTGDIRYRLNKTDWSTFVEDNDWSYHAPWEYISNDHVTAYYQGKLVYGTEPGTPATAARSTAAASPLATTAAAGPASLLEAYPNPVVSATTVQFRAAQAGRALVQVYNPLGQLVATLYDEAVEDGRTYELPFATQSLANGLYEFRLVLGSNTLTKRLAISH
jgi:hypothetical protein